MLEWRVVKFLQSLFLMFENFHAMSLAMPENG